jgi:hypothetical protein
MTVGELMKMLSVIDSDAEVTVLDRTPVRLAVDVLRVMAPGSEGRRDRKVDIQLHPACYANRPDSTKPKIEGLGD